MSERLNAILETLGDLPDLTRFADIIELIRGVYDIDHISYFAMSLGLDAHEHPDPSVRILPEVDGVLVQTGRKLGAMSFSCDWLRWYMEGGHVETDPVLLGAQASFDPIDWGEIDWQTKALAQFRGGAEDLGVGSQGYTIPVRGPSGQMALFTVNKSCDRDTWELLLAEFRTDFMLLAHFTHQRVLKLAGVEHLHPVRQLSARERDAIRLLAEGMSRGRASESLGISENTLRVYIDSARHKLGALNIPHAIALAAHRGIIRPT